MAISQVNQSMSVITPLGEDELLFKQMFGSEKLGQLFEFEVELVSEHNNIEHDKLLAETITVCAQHDDGDRYFNGHVSRFSFGGLTEDGLSLYRATLVPWLWFLTHQANCRIFQEKSVPEIIKEVFKDSGFSDFEENLSGTYSPLEYCVQYRETDFNFISRLMEQEGIYYHFVHTEDKHQLVLTDSVSSHKSVGELIYTLNDPNTLPNQCRYIFTWNNSQVVCPSQYALSSFNFKTPTTNLEVHATDPDSTKTSEIFDYPGEYNDESAGEKYVKIRLQEMLVGQDIVEGTTKHNQPAAGTLFELCEHQRDDQNQEYLITSTQYQLRSSGYGSGSNSETEEIYSCQFTAIESKKDFRPQRMTAKPSIQGLQTAIVVGPEKEEIYTDEFGRVKVQFHWDREGLADENSSCWVRVAQLWAGKAWGAIFLPRIGHEVIVSFLEGDPNQPIITGSVYNNDNSPPHPLPNFKTKSGIVSRSSKEGTGQNSNELTFDDTKDAEEIYLHAEHDFNQVVENNATLKVGFDKSKEGDSSTEIFNNQSIKVGCKDATDGSQTTEIYNDRTTTLEEGDDTLDINKGNRTVTIASGDLTIDISSGKGNITAGTSIELKVSGSSIKIDSSSITLATGGSSIKLEAAKITLKSVAIDIKGDATLDAKSPMTTINGDGVLTLKGGITKIN
ncbi:MAG: type VI secretion system tip protein VgrG [Candidatus Polarisedimenticolaceae bacterium]|nr:type VI secretion system tip protein VgrG [Candidatus Polarisedimenticolaceae bacterium]